MPNTDSEPFRTVIPEHSGRGCQRRWSNHNYSGNLSSNHKPYEEGDYADKEINKRYKDFFKTVEKDETPDLTDGQIAYYRSKWEDLSEFVRDIKQGFSRFYNKRHNRRGFFWAERFKSVIVDNGDTLINCLAYIDLNPVRAKMVEKPEQYRWSSIGYHIQRKNEDGFLSLDFGPGEMRSAVTNEFHGVNLQEFGTKKASDRLKYYRKFLYEKGDITDVDKEQARNFKLNEFDRFRYRTRYFIDSGVIGSKEFVDPSASPNEFHVHH